MEIHKCFEKCEMSRWLSFSLMRLEYLNLSNKKKIITYFVLIDILQILTFHYFTSNFVIFTKNQPFCSKI
jgi:hypothetical protein